MIHQSKLVTNNLIYFLLALFTLLKIIVSYYLPVFGDETYYLYWGQNLQLSYFDHPPFVAWLTYISDFLLKTFTMIDRSVLLRLPFVLLSSLTLYFMILCYQKIDFHERKTLSLTIFFILCILNPFLGLGGLLVTPDTPMMFFWVLSFYFVLNIIQSQSVKWYIYLGVSLGLGFCAKYHIVLFPIILLIAFFLEKRLYQIKFKKLILTIIFGFIFCLPVLIWNYQNDWASFKFQLDHGFASREITWLRPLTYVAAQFVLFNTVLSFILWFKSKSNLSIKMAIAQWLFFLYSSLRSTVEANWPISSHAQGLLGLGRLTPRMQKLSIVHGLFLWTALALLLSSDLGQKKLSQTPQSLSANDLYLKTKGYRPLYGPTYQMASLVSFVGQERIVKLPNLSRYDFYDQSRQYLPTEKIFYALKYTVSDWPEWLTKNNSGLTYVISEVRSFDEYQLKLYKIESELQ